MGLNRPVGHLQEILTPVTMEKYRPMLRSHFVRISYLEEDDAYKPSEISLKAVVTGLRKYNFVRRPIPQAQILSATLRLVDLLTPIFVNCKVLTFDEALMTQDLSGSPGFPWYFKYPTKRDVVLHDLELLRWVCDKILVADWEAKYEFCGEFYSVYESVFTIMPKSELRPKEKVDLHQTRDFTGGNFHHLLVSCMLFHDQNMKLMYNPRLHPVTIGIQVPGHQFIDLMWRIWCGWDGDGSGFDLRFPVEVARIIREARKTFIPEHFHQAVDWAYDSAYAGFVYFMGTIYQMFSQKSGWFNTGMDGSLYSWIANEDCFRVEHPTDIMSQVLQLFVNTDDWIMGKKLDWFKFDVLRHKQLLLERWNLDLEIGSSEALPKEALTYLSHTVRMRFVDGLGDFMVAAGNLPKLLASRSWCEPTSSLSFGDAVLAHMLGVRLCLFPWRVDFLEYEAEIDSWLKSYNHTSTTPFILKARLSEYRIGLLHARVE